MSTNLVLTTRKAISLCFSVWWFGNGWNAQLGVGAGMVFLGSLLYTAVTARGSKPPPVGAVASASQNGTGGAVPNGGGRAKAKQRKGKAE